MEEGRRVEEKKWGNRKGNRREGGREREKKEEGKEGGTEERRNNKRKTEERNKQRKKENQVYKTQFSKSSLTDPQHTYCCCDFQMTRTLFA